MQVPAVIRPLGAANLRRGEDGPLLVLALLASVLGAAAITLFAYKTSPLFALALPALVGVVVLVFLQPMAGVYLALLAVPLERIAVPAGAAAELTPAKGLLVLTAAAGIVRFLLHGHVRSVHHVFLAYAGLLMWMAIGIGLAPEPFTVTKLLVQWASFGIVAMLIATGDRKQLERIFICLAIAGGAIGAIAVTTSGTQELVAGGAAASGRAQAGFAHPAVLGFFLVMAFPPAVALALSGRPALRIPMAGCAALAAAGIMFSLTRGAIVALAVSLLVMLFWTPFRRWAIGLLCIVLLFGVFNADAIQRSQQLEVLTTRLSTITQTKATQQNERPYIWSKTPAMIVDHPFFGVGAGEFPLYAPRYAIVDSTGEAFSHAHNVPLTIAAELGLIGLAFLVWMVGTLAATAVRMIARARSHPAFPYAIATTASLTASAVTGTLDYPPGTVVIFGVLMVVIGCFVCADRLTREPAPD